MFQDKIIYGDILDVEVASLLKINDASHYTIIWVDKETVSCNLNFERKKVKANSILVLNPGEVLYATSKDVCAFTMLLVKSQPNAILKKYFNSWLNTNHFNDSIIEFEGQTANHVKTFFTTIIKLSRSNDNKNLLIEYYINKILLSALNAKIEKQCRTTLAFDKLVLNYYKTDHIVANYADKLKVMPKQLLIKLNKQGLSNPHNIIKKRLVVEAKKLLAFTDKPIKEICYEIGFDDPAYFARFFKKNSGIQALKFRKQFRN